jgi:hypothetical protein
MSAQRREQKGYSARDDGLPQLGQGRGFLKGVTFPLSPCSSLKSGSAS